MTYPWEGIYPKIFIIALIVSTLLTPFIRKLAIYAGAMDKPSGVKIHKHPTPRLGGVAIFFGFLFSILAMGEVTPDQKTVLIGATMAFIVGILDDTRSVSAVVKLIVLFIITAFLAINGVILSLVPWPWVNFILTLFWIVGVTSAFNAMDNMDGLAAGLTFFASLAYAYVAVQNGQWGWGALAFALMGSSLGFLFFNFPPAKIFMGDSGSFFLGYCLAAMSVIGAWSTNPFKAIVVPIFILGLPIFDLIFVVVKRHHSRVTRTIREVVTFSGKDHFSHRLLKLGMSQKQAVVFTYFVALALSLGAISMRYVQRIEAILLCIQYFVITMLIIILMEYVDRRDKKPIEF
ncbi:MAG: undecaprenyl/decaprenyl-phosphate alpha-N-acetylglucosaminyl 1-phosphate transferase [Candidatus Omnitrophica bacterium]|nr:undecaprenyl/decaprenyl-phosphate alpha-N-acetylglucosaminyl 1-phosphate transferase [Candidatus Omnitrophota bacterium]